VLFLLKEFLLQYSYDYVDFVNVHLSCTISCSSYLQIVPSGSVLVDISERGSSWGELETTVALCVFFFTFYALVVGRLNYGNGIFLGLFGVVVWG